MCSGSTSATRGFPLCTTKTGGHTIALNNGSPKRQVGLSSKAIKLAAVALVSRRPISKVISPTNQFAARRADQDLPQPPEVRPADARQMPRRLQSAPQLSVPTKTPAHRYPFLPAPDRKGMVSEFERTNLRSR